MRREEGLPSSSPVKPYKYSSIVVDLLALALLLLQAQIPCSKDTKRSLTTYQGASPTRETAKSLAQYIGLEVLVKLN